MTLQKPSFRKTGRCLCLNICAAELKPLVGARQSGATGKQRTFQERSENMARVNRSCKEAYLRRQPRAHVCTTLGDEGNMLQLFGHGDNCEKIQPCHRGRRLLHLPRQSWHTYQSDGNGVCSNGQDVPSIGDPDADLILLGVSMFL